MYKLSCTAIFAFLLSCSQITAAHQPNILLILTDDQGWPTLGCYGGKIVPTPNLDRLAGEGAMFTDAYVTSQCIPTRATLLTGQYTARHRLWHVLSWYGYPWARMTEPAFAENFPRETFTLAKGLRQAGYVTGIMGKWHLTSNADGNYRGLQPKASKYYGFDYAPPLLSNKEFAPGADRGVNTLTNQAVDFIAKNKDRPWFCYLSHHTIHGVVVAPEELTQKYRIKGYGDKGPNRAVYLAALEHIDHSVGRLMASLKEMGEEDETIVIFLSDNGGIHERFDFRDLPNPHPAFPTFRVDLREYNNDPLRGGKGSCYEGGVRVPMIVRWPKRIPKKKTIKTPVHVIDLMPTLFEVAGAKAPTSHPMDGASLQKLLTAGKDRNLSKRALFQYYPFYDLRWGLTPCASIRKGDHVLVEFFGDRVNADRTYVPGHHLELYNLGKDLGQSHNLAKADSKRAERLQKELHQWMKSLSAQPSVLNKHYEPQRAFEETRKKPEWLKNED